MNIKEIWEVGMSSDSPGCIFGVLQMLLGKNARYEGPEIYAGNQAGDDSHIEN